MRGMCSPKRGVACVTAMLIVLVCLCPGGARVGAQDGLPPSHQSCETKVWNNFWAANDTYTTTLQSWYFERPTTCFDECWQSCGNQYVHGSPDWYYCMGNCPNNCEQTRYSAFTSAQDGLARAAQEIGSCDLSPDFCSVARQKRDECEYNFMSVDGEMPWYTAEEHAACIEASGIWRCE